MLATCFVLLYILATDLILFLLLLSLHTFWHRNPTPMALSQLKKKLTKRKITNVREWGWVCRQVWVNLSLYETNEIRGFVYSHTMLNVPNLTWNTGIPLMKWRRCWEKKRDEERGKWSKQIDKSECTHTELGS